MSTSAEDACGCRTYFQRNSERLTKTGQVFTATSALKHRQIGINAGDNHAGQS